MDSLNAPILSLDIGERYIGCAMSDEEGIVVSPLPAIFRFSETFPRRWRFREISKIAKKYRCQKVVIGIPYLLDGSPSEQTKLVREYVKKLKKHISSDIVLFDERLSTSEVRRRYPHLRKAKSEEEIENRDSFCAVEILKNYLDIDNW